MKEYFNILKASQPFCGFSDEELEAVLGTLGVNPASYPKGSIIFSQGEAVTHAGVLLAGSIIAESVSYGGNRRVMQTLSPGDLFGDVLMSSLNHPTPVSTIAKEDSKVLFLSISDLVDKTCDPLCKRVLMNMLHGIADKFWNLNRKIDYLSCKEMRQRIAMFLLDMHKQYSSLTFRVEYSREELASLLSVNRSALSRELSRMQTEGIISYYRSAFKIEDLNKLSECL